jgi:hypothetical protein
MATRAFALDDCGSAQGTGAEDAGVTSSVIRSRAASFAAFALVAAGCSGCLTGKSDDSRMAGAKRRPALSLDAQVRHSPSTFGLTTRVPRRVIADCRTLAARAHRRGSSRPVYCLPLVPKAGWIRIEAAGGFNGYRRVEDGIIVSVRSALAMATGRRVPTAHWSFAEGKPSVVVGQYLPPERGRKVRRAYLDGHAVVVYGMPKGFGLYSGHVVIEWTQRKVAFQVSMHGHRNLERAALMARALMRQVAACARSRPRPGTRVCDLVF